MCSSPRRRSAIYGERLGELVLKTGLGVNVKLTYAIDEIDEDYFLDEE
jgi:restriction endonuclease Mrr